MAPIPLLRLAALNFCKRPNNIGNMRSAKDPGRKRPALPVFLISPHLMYSALSMIANFETQQMQPPLMKLNSLITRRVQDGLLTAIVTFLSKTTTANGTKKERKLTKGQRKCRVVARKCWERALKLERELDLDGAIQYLERAVELQPHNPKYLGMLSKQYTDMSFASNITPQEAREFNEKALTIAEKLVDLNPADPVGYIARGVSKGRLAYYSNNRQKIELAREAEDSVKDALNLNDNCDLGHHLMGRFHYEMAGLNMFCRAFVRVVYGKRMSPGSYEEALKEFEKANKLNPERLIHKIQIGKTYNKLGNKQQAVESLQDALNLDVTDINDHLEQLDGIELLDKLKHEI